MKKKRFQIIKKLIESDADHSISVTLDKQYSKVTHLFAYANPTATSNINLTRTSPLRINHEEILPVNFDTALLFPTEHNTIFTKINADAANSTLEVTVKFEDYIEEFNFTILCVLEND